MSDFSSSEQLEHYADQLESKKQQTRRKFLQQGATMLTTLLIGKERMLSPENEQKVHKDVLRANEPIPFPFQNLDFAQIAAKAQKHLPTDDPQLADLYNAKITKIKTGFSELGFSYGNPTPYGDKATVTKYFNNIAGSFPDLELAKKFLDRGLLIAPNPFYFSPDFRGSIFQARDNALAAAGLSIDALKNGGAISEKLFNAHIQKISQTVSIDAQAKQARGKTAMLVVLKPRDGTYLPEGPYWKDNTTDLGAKAGWEIQYANMVMFGDLKDPMHLCDSTKELTGKRASNFVCDVENSLFTDVCAY
nr:hypothetical protein [Candidatus Woesebacteria bacterium]